MEINKPDEGIMRGMGKLEVPRFINKKFFPSVRNQHQFEFTHNHRNEYKTTFASTNKSYLPKDYHYEKVKKNHNYSQFSMGA